MKKRKIFTIFTLIIVIFIGILLYVRINNNKEIPHDFYTQWRKNYVEKDSNSAFVNATPQKLSATALSEAQGYGMIITMMATQKNWANRTDFNHLFKFYLNHRTIINKHQTQLMSWKQVEKGKQMQNRANSATDGDLLIAYSLFLAAKKWPNHPEYRTQGLKIANDILKYDYNSKNHVLTIGNWANSKSKYYNLIRSSDIMPFIFTALYKESRDKRWLAINNHMLKALSQLSKQHKTGLIPDFAVIKDGYAKPVKAHYVATRYDGDFSDNACRIPMNLVYANTAKTDRIVKKMLNFFDKQSKITAGYTLTGKALNNYQSAAFSAPIFIAVSNFKNQGYDGLFMSEQYIFNQKLTQNNYYPDTLTTLAAFMLE